MLYRLFSNSAKFLEFGNFPDMPDTTISSSGVDGNILEYNFCCCITVAVFGVGGILRTLIKLDHKIEGEKKNCTRSVLSTLAKLLK